MKLNLGFIASFASICSGLGTGKAKLGSWDDSAEDWEIKSKDDLKLNAHYFLINKKYGNAMTNFGYGPLMHVMASKRHNGHSSYEQMWYFKQGPYRDTYYIYNAGRPTLKLGLHPGTLSHREWVRICSDHLELGRHEYRGCSQLLYPERDIAQRVYQTYDSISRHRDSELWYIEELPSENGVAQFALRNYQFPDLFLGQHRGTNFGRDATYPDVNGDINPVSFKQAWRYNWENVDGHRMTFPNGKDQLDRHLIWEFQPRFKAEQSIERVWSSDNRQNTCRHCESTEVTFSSESFSSTVETMDYNVEASISASYGAVSASVTASFGQSWESAKSYTQAHSSTENIRYCAQPATNKLVFQIKTTFTDLAGRYSTWIKSGPMTLTCCNCNFWYMSDEQKLDWLKSGTAEICFDDSDDTCPDE